MTLLKYPSTSFNGVVGGWMEVWIGKGIRYLSLMSNEAWLTSDRILSCPDVCTAFWFWWE